ncbi:hypothetical protein [uncultured Roseibium sp.]|uniref:hypothetical protein n=1 Tax=uncultured Roseibium sp. TaxID=1936171 RepID=UPI003217A1B3
METALVRPPLPSYTAITPATRAPERTEPATKTDLPASNTVTPSAEGEQNRPTAENEKRGETRLDAVRPQIERKNIVDAESDSLIYVATDSDSGEVVRQVPSETLLKLRAYAKTVSDQSNETANQGVERTV